ncbi:MAG: META domain-containing protein [Alphaproteobacteria bacterium]|nr:META domain-containing protein [Alphaproteobacteria bacterium]
MKKIFIVISCIVGVLLLMSFLPSSKSEAKTPIGREFIWKDAPEGVEVSLGFGGQENRFFGQAPVNRYFGFYDVTNNKLTLTDMGTTMMMGPENLMELEQQYLKDLASVKRYEFKDKQLYLLSDDGKKLIFNEIPARFY